MNKRIRGLILPIPLLLAGQAAQALGLGEIKVESALEQPLKGQIRLILNAGESLENLQVKLAAAEDYERVGLDPTLVPPTIKLALRKGPAGPYIEITSSQPVNEPIVSLLLEADWPKGRLLREYTLLLDPPSYAPVATVAPAQLNEPDNFDEVVQEQPAAPVETPDPEPVPVPESAAEQQSVAEVDSTLTREFPVEKPPRPDTVTVTAGSTLWSIASNNRPDGVSVQQMMVAILRANPEAFLDGNMNKLKKGSLLRIPEAAEIADISRQEALAEVAAQSQQWVAYQDKAREMVPSAYQTESSEPVPETPAKANNDYTLDLVPPKGESDADSHAAGSTESKAPDYAELALAREGLATLEQEKQELASRIEELESIVNDQQAVLQMKDADLAKLQQQLASLNEQRQALENSMQAAQDDVQTITDEVAAEVESPAQETENTTMASAAETATEDTVAVSDAEAEVDDVWDQENALTDAGDNAEATGEQAMDTTDDMASNAEATAALVEEPVLVNETETSTTTAAPVVEDKPWWQKALGWITGNPLYAAGGALLLLLLGLLPRVLRKGDDEGGEGSFLDSIGSREDRGDEPTTETPLDAAGDFNIDELLERIEQEPDNVDLLYDAALYYYGEDDRQQFENMAEELYGRLADPGHPRWQEIAQLGQKIAPENTLFGLGSLTEDHEVSEEPLAATDETQTSDESPIAADDSDDMSASDNAGDESATDDEFDFGLDEFIADDETATETEGEETLADNALDLADDLKDNLSDDLPDDLDITLEEPLKETDAGADVSETGNEDNSLTDLLGELETAPDEELAETLASVAEDSVSGSDIEEPELSLEDLESELESIALDSERDAESAENDSTPAVDLDLDIEDSEDLMDFDFGEENDEQAKTDETDAGQDEQEEAVDLGFNLDDIVPEGDAVATKLDLARAYYEMGDIEGARIMLEEVLEEGNAEQQEEARKLQDEMDGS